MKIYLRNTTESDLDFVLNAERSAENRKFVTVWTRKKHLSAVKSGDFFHFIIENVDKKAVGYIIVAGIIDVNRNIEFRRLVITEKNKGYGKAALVEIKKVAFEKLNAHRFWLDVKEHNLRARQLYEKVGFTTEGILRESLKTESGFESLVVMSILESEYINFKIGACSVNDTTLEIDLS
jgi:diamine N-acetyltransferase